MNNIYLIGAIIALFGFIMYEKTQAKYVKILKSEIIELNMKLEKQQEIINTKFNVKDL